MEEFIIYVDKRIILVYMSVTVAALLFLRQFGSFIFSSLIISLFEGFTHYLRADLLILIKSDLPAIMHEHRTFFWYGGWVMINLCSILAVRQGHRLLQLKLGRLAIVYMFSSLLLIVLHIVGYVDTVYFEKTEMVNMFYSVGLDVLRVTVALVMLFQLIATIRSERIQWKTL